MGVGEVVGEGVEEPGPEVGDVGGDFGAAGFGHEAVVGGDEDGVVDEEVVESPLGHPVWVDGFAEDLVVFVSHVLGFHEGMGKGEGRTR